MTYDFPILRRNIPSDCVHISGSHGELLVHRKTGVVAEVIQHCHCEDCQRLGTYEETVALFNVNDIEAEADCRTLDILWVGFWDRSGGYEPACTTRLVWSEKWGEDFDASVPKALLPAPATC